MQNMRITLKNLSRWFHRFPNWGHKQQLIEHNWVNFRLKLNDWQYRKYVCIQEKATKFRWKRRVTLKKLTPRTSVFNVHEHSDHLSVGFSFTTDYSL